MEIRKQYLRERFTRASSSNRTLPYGVTSSMRSNSEDYFYDSKSSNNLNEMNRSTSQQVFIIPSHKLFTSLASFERVFLFLFLFFLFFFYPLSSPYVFPESSTFFFSCVIGVSSSSISQILMSFSLLYFKKKNFVDLFLSFFDTLCSHISPYISPYIESTRQE